MAILRSSIPAGISRSKEKMPIPPLEQGDRLNRSEFLKRYAAMPPGVKAERIEGTIYMPAAVSATFHGTPHANLVTWLGVYSAATSGVVVADNSTIALDMDNDPQPDVCLYILHTHGGNTKINAEGYIVGAPELIVEVAASSLSYDLGVKLNSYRRNGVREYLVHRTYDGELDWFVLRDGQYERLLPDDQGLYRSEIFPGLWLKADALIAGKLGEVLTILHQGIASVEHSEWVGKLEGKTLSDGK